MPPAAANGNTALVRIDRFEVEVIGDTLLSPEKIDSVLEPYKGDARSYADIQRALEALEGAYRAAGYSAVHVVTPEQDVTDGVVTLQVYETVIGTVKVSGNKYYDESNIRSALPALIENTTPNARALSENIRLANENPTRQVDVVLAVGDEENQVDANVNVKDSDPQKIFLTLDNTGNPATGMYRAGVGYQYNNVLDRDQAGTLNYITSPEHPSGVKEVSGSYRIPLYSIGDSIDLVAAYSDVSAGTTSTIAGPLSFSGQGQVYEGRYNQYLPRAGDYTAQVIYGLDDRMYTNACSLGVFGAAGCGSAAAPVTVHPLSLAYEGALTKPAYNASFNTTVLHNISGGPNGGAANFDEVRPSPTGQGGAQPGYSILRMNGNLIGAMPRDWQYRVAGNIQYTPDSLIPEEAFGLAGANAVRGFLEREVTSDRGYVLNLELYTPELAPALRMGDANSMRLLAFVDEGKGWNVLLPGELPSTPMLASTGVGLRFSEGKNITARLDLAKILESKDTASVVTPKGHHRAVINVVATW
jgi:hemolysin activation/secretion protein